MALPYTIPNSGSLMGSVIDEQTLLKEEMKYLKLMISANSLKLADVITSSELLRLISLIESPDKENHIVAEEIIKQKLKQ